MKDWFSGARDYMTTCFEPAREIASKYISAGIDFFKADKVSDGERSKFQTVVSDADLTGPLVVI
jgi:hypothetical protein